MRISYIDTAKFLAIFLVVFTHSDASGCVASWFFYQFHVPLFFVLFGFIYGIKAKKVGKPVFYKLIIRILVPFFLLAFVLGERPDNPRVFFDILYGSAQTLGRSSAAHLWFLPCYFVSVLSFSGLESIRTKSGVGKFIFSVLLSIAMLFSVVFSLGTIDSPFADYRKSLPWSINAAMSGVVMIYIGMVLSRVNSFIFSVSKPKAFFLFLLATCIGIASSCSTISGNQFISMASSDYGFYPIYICRIAIMSFAILFLSRTIDNKCFSYAGRYTLLIYGIHIVIMGGITAICKLIWEDGIIMDIPLMSGILKTIVTVAVCTLLVPFFRQYLPEFIGVNNSSS